MSGRAADQRALVAVAALAVGCGRIGYEVVPPPTTLDADVPDACAGAVFCDGFEEGLVQWDGTAVGVGATASVDQGAGRDGGNALRATAPVGAATAGVYADVLPATAADLWVRTYLRTATGVTVDFEPVRVTDPTQSAQLVFSLYEGSLDIHAHGMANEFMVAAPVAIPRDRWTCFELHVRVGAAGAVELFMDDVLVAAMQALDTRPPVGDLTRLVVGLPSKPDDIATEVLVDDVRAGTSPLGCD